MSKIAIISLKYHPGHYSHLIASYQLLESCGFNCVLYVNKKFNSLDSSNYFNKVNKIQINEYKDYKFAIFWFPSIRNIFDILKFKLLGKTKIVYVFHEPIDSYSDFYNSGFNFIKICKLFLIDIFNKITLLFSNHIILPSQKALKVYKKKYTRFNKYYSTISLLFDDHNILPNFNLNSRKYISFIGTTATDHGFIKFCNFIEFALKFDLFPKYTFLIATGSKISIELKAKFAKIGKPNRIKILEGTWLTNNQIYYFYNCSVVVWNAYDRSSQSGVLPMSFMFCTPVLGNLVISNEYIVDGSNGIYLQNNNNISEIIFSIEKIIKNFESYSKNSRDTFLNKFYFKNHTKEFLKILNYE